MRAMRHSRVPRRRPRCLRNTGRWSLASLVASPFVSAGKLIGGVENHALLIDVLVAEIETQWNATTNRPLDVVAGRSHSRAASPSRFATSRRTTRIFRLSLALG